MQRYLETHRAPAAVLGSLPPKGFVRLALRVWLRHPLTAARAFVGGTLLEFVDTPAMARDWHNMMIEPGWVDVAARIHGWLEERDLNR